MPEVYWPSPTLPNLTKGIRFWWRDKWEVIETPTLIAPGTEVKFVLGSGEQFVYDQAGKLKGNKMANLVLNRQTLANRKSAAEEAKRAATGRQAHILLETHAWSTDDLYATLCVVNEHGGRIPDPTGVSTVYLQLDETDLEALQNAVFAARVKLHKAKNGGLKNPSLSGLCAAEYDPF